MSEVTDKQREKLPKYVVKYIEELEDDIETRDMWNRCHKCNDCGTLHPENLCCNSCGHDNSEDEDHE